MSSSDNWNVFYGGQCKGYNDSRIDRSVNVYLKWEPFPTVSVRKFMARKSPNPARVTNCLIKTESAKFSLLCIKTGSVNSVWKLLQQLWLISPLGSWKHLSWNLWIYTFCYFSRFKVPSWEWLRILYFAWRMRSTEVIFYLDWSSDWPRPRKSKR